jgi:hypothetical protein
VKHRKPSISLFETEDHIFQRISNTAWAYGTADQLFEGDYVLTSEQYYEYLDGQYEWEPEQHVARNFGDCGAPITGTGDYEQMMAEEARAHFYGAPNPYLI